MRVVMSIIHVVGPIRMIPSPGIAIVIGVGVPFVILARICSQL